ncbi:hypothetical protein Slin15195_G084350 [Septoria linicola]|uniref:Uncharacterized protein n=1 Tax=Septoria linicola TaxID=215465 RepID=A0A9Q9B0K4_9PEZI|nr:hypothetical protein Slin15195_G084350 [Septoria linicola]
MSKQYDGRRKQDSGSIVNHKPGSLRLTIIEKLDKTTSDTPSCDDKHRGRVSRLSPQHSLGGARPNHTSQSEYCVSLEGKLHKLMEGRRGRFYP